VITRADPETALEDHVVLLRTATWADYERLGELRGDSAVPRLTYLEGDLEIMSPSRDHERLEPVIGQLVEAYCLHQGIRFSAFGSWTLKQEAAASAAEPDECYVFGPAPRASGRTSPSRSSGARAGWTSSRRSSGAPSSRTSTWRSS